jgi:putative glutamine amidotransferase
MRVLLAHSDSRSNDAERFAGAWKLAGGLAGELLPIAPATPRDLAGELDGEVAGLVLAGGPDVEPRRYGAEPIHGVALHPDPARDDLDLDLLARAEHVGWPVLAVCYGCQVLAVSRGGAIIQDLDLAGFPGHTVREPRNLLAHAVEVQGDSRLLAGLPRGFGVNSRHHQAVAGVGPGLRVAALAPDGVIEAVEGVEEDRFVLGVQWHPEDLHAEPHLGIFRLFRDACQQRG